MQPTEIINRPDWQPLCPDQNGAVGTTQHIEIIDCPDRPDCPDQFHDILVDNQTVHQKKSASARLAERLQRRRKEVENPSSMFSRVKYISQETLESSQTVVPEVGTVEIVGTISENNALTSNLWSGQGSGQSGQGLAAPQSVAAPSLRAAAGLQELPRDADGDDTEDWGLIPQSIPHTAMVAGLLAASRIRPRAEPPPAAGDDVAVWARGVAQLQKMPPLPGFAAARWASIVYDCARLLARNGPDLRRLGWRVEDAFGVHPDAPGDAVHCYGLGLLLNGGNVVELTGQGAVIELPNGVRQTFWRSARAGAVPVWAVPHAPAAAPGRELRQ